MWEHEEQLLVQVREEYERMPVPAELDAYIEKGLRQGQFKVRRARRRRQILIACVLIAAFVIPVRVSPAFAAFVSKLPGMEYVVKLINYDRGLISAVENEFVQHVNVSDSKDGVVFTVKDVIVDEARMIIFYSLDQPQLDVRKFEFFDEAGNPLQEYSAAFDGILGDSEVKGQMNGKVELSFTPQTVLPDSLALKAYVLKRESEPVQPVPAEENANALIPLNPLSRESQSLERAIVFEVKIPLDSSFRGLKEVYELNETVDMEGQKVLFKRVTIYPTRISLDLEFDPANRYKIFQFDDLRFVDEEGATTAGIGNGITATYPAENQQTLYFQSNNYFNKPRELYLAGSSARALSKELSTVQVDLKNQKLLGQPDGRLALEQVRVGEDELALEFQLLRDPLKDKHQYSVFSSRYLDAAGAEHSSIGETSYQDPDTGVQHFSYHLRRAEAGEGPVTLSIADYPNHIEQEFKIRIK